MSRSYKKNPWITDHKRKTTKNNKKIANRIFRRKLKGCEELPSLNHHKKITESWNICDYKWRMTREEAIHWYESKEKDYEASAYFLKRYPSLESWLNYWEKCHRRK